MQAAPGTVGTNASLRSSMYVQALLNVTEVVKAI
jgi:hypothetical protein